MMKKLIMTVLIMVGTLTGWANDYSYLSLQKADGTETMVSVSDLVLTVSDGQLVATNSDGTATFTLADLSKMFFANTSSGISTAVTAIPASGEQVEVYTTGGIFVGRYDSMATAKSNLRSGIYVMKTNDRTFKTAVK